jgi:hypothetical protein
MNFTPTQIGFTQRMAISPCLVDIERAAGAQPGFC